MLEIFYFILMILRIRPILNMFKNYKITGMHCVNCEERVERAAVLVPGILKAEADSRSFELSLEVEESVFNENILTAALHSLGYRLAGAVEKSRSWKRSVFFTGAFLAVLFVVYLFIGRLTVMADALAARDEFSIWAAVIIGVVASSSTCLALIGGIVLSFSAKFQTEGNSFRSIIAPQIKFHVGRLISFFVFGGLLGLVGQWFSLSTKFNAVLILAVAAIMLSFGISNLGFDFRSLMPRGSRRAFGWIEKMKKSNHASAPFILGAITFFLPCGFTQSMQLTAIAIGGFWPAAWLMFAFAFGTLPVLFTLGAASGSGRFGSPWTKKIIGAIIIIFAVYTSFTAFALLNIGGASGTINIKEAAKAQEISMTVDANGFTPNVFTLKRGVPARWTITATGLTGCNNRIIVPGLSMEKKLTYGKNVIEFTPTETGVIKFSCWMGMIRGKFNVVD